MYPPIHNGVLETFIQIMIMFHSIEMIYGLILSRPQTEYGTSQFKKNNNNKDK